jgi:hypothetical protein
VSLLQGQHAEQSLKWRPERLQLSMDTYLRLAAQAHPADHLCCPKRRCRCSSTKSRATYLRGLTPARRCALIGASP